MSEGSSVYAHCAGCGRAIYDPAEPREPCVCGSTTRNYGRSIAESAGPTEDFVRYVAKSKRYRKRGGVFATGETKAEVYSKTGRRQYVERGVNRLENRYVERIVDAETGEVIKEVNEPLDRHQDHGSARPDRRT